MAVDYGVPVELYIEGLQAELAAVTGKSDADKAHRTEIEAELMVAQGEPATPTEAPTATPVAQF